MKLTKEQIELVIEVFKDYSNLEYLGFCKLFIMQELGLYVFEIVKL